MKKKDEFCKLCEVMANLENIIQTSESIGLDLNPDVGIGRDIYYSCSALCNIATELLDSENISTTKENEICNTLFQMTPSTVQEIAMNIWTQYGSD